MLSRTQVTPKVIEKRLVHAHLGPGIFEERGKGQPVEEEPQDEHAHHDRGYGQVGIYAPEREEPVRDIAADDDEAPMGDIDEPHHPHDEAEAEGHEAVKGTHDDTDQKGLDNRAHRLQDSPCPDRPP